MVLSMKQLHTYKYAILTCAECSTPGHYVTNGRKNLIDSILIQT